MNVCLYGWMLESYSESDQFSNHAKHKALIAHCNALENRFFHDSVSFQKQDDVHAAPVRLCY